MNFKFKNIVFLLLFFSSVKILGQNHDSIPSDTSYKYMLKEVVVTATRSLRNKSAVIQSNETITSEELQQMPVFNVDDALRSIANVSVNRSWGVYSKNSSVTMRGTGSSSRVLILQDGVPMNKIAGGSVNWHILNPEAINKIEIVKGPSSSLYGNNAMGGVINFISKEATEKLQGDIRIYGGTFKTFGGNVWIGGSNTKNNKGFVWSVNSFYRTGEGYVYVPENLAGPYDIPLNLLEYNTGLNLKYKTGKNSSVRISGDYYHDRRGTGYKAFQEPGNYDSYTDKNIQLNYKTNFHETELNADLYFQLEDYEMQNESMNSFNEYRFYITNSRKIDKGGNITFSKKILKKHLLTGGLEVKEGSVNSLDNYKTSTDSIIYSGNLLFSGIYMQDEVEIFNKKWLMLLGGRFDFANFYNGALQVYNPSPVTGFAESINEKFAPNSWSDISLKFALKHFIDKHNSAYTSVSQGFMPPRLDDLCKSGKIRKGFKIANPGLLPEKLTNFELGYSYNKNENLRLGSAVYYSLGNDFQYLVATGDVIDMGGEEKEVFKRENISEVQIYGCEASVDYVFRKNIIVKMSYSYNHSVILRYNANDTENDLTGKILVEVPPHEFFAGVTWKNKYFNFDVNYSFADEQWNDDDNTELVASYDMLNVKIYRTFLKKLTASFEVQNLLDKEFIDRKGRLSPGRFMLFNLSYKIGKL